jgi:hypothetical protein
MAAHQVGGLWIVMLGALFFATSFPLPRLVARSHGVVALIGSPLLRWMTRLFGLLVCGLGLVTFLR